MSQQKFKISFNQHIINKPSQGAGLNQAINWIPYELTQCQIIDKIKQGMAYSAHFKNNYRKSENFICSDFIAVDIDNGVQIEDILESEYIKKHCSFIYTTHSHTELAHRFRIVFLLEKTITKKENWKYALRGIGHKLRGDPTIKDAARQFYGNSKCKIYKLNNVLNEEELDEIILFGKQIKKDLYDKSITQQTIFDINSINHKFDIIKTSEGNLISIDDIPSSTSVYCPIHVDKNPSAFTVQSRNGVKGIHCSTCSMTYWHHDPGDYILDEFDQIIEKMQKENYHSDKLPVVQNIKIISKKYLDNIPYQIGVHCVKSPKGSGKTEILKKIVETVKAQKYPKSIQVKHRSKSVLLIGHRQTLLREAANKLGLVSYLDETNTSNFYAVCLDSLFSRLKKCTVKYDLIIIDESEQVFQHLLSDTLEDRIGIENSWAALKHVILKAKSVIALDADLGFLTINALKNIRKSDWENNFYITYNEYIQNTQDAKKIELYANEQHLINDLIETINEDKKCFIVSNSKNFIHALAETLKEKCGGNRNILTITADNSGDQFMIEFVKNIKTRILDYQALLASPSLGTGVDITFPDNQQNIDCVYGFFKNGINTHFDIDQQISRVRHPKKIKIWLSTRRVNYETNFEVIMSNLAKAGAVPSSNHGYDDDFNPHYDKNHPLLQIYTHVICSQRSSQKNLYKNFLSLKNKQGWEIVFIEREINSSKHGASAFQQGRLKQKQNKIENILNAPKIDDQVFLDMLIAIDEKRKLSKKEKFIFERAKLERTFKQEVNDKLIEMNEGDNLINQVSILHNVMSLVETSYNDIAINLINDIYFDEEKNRNWGVRNNRDILILVMLWKVGLINRTGFNTQNLLSIDDLSDLIKFWIKNKTIIEYQFNTVLREDVKTNPIKQLNFFLQLMGLKTVKSKKQMIKGVSRYYYELDQKSYKFIMSLVSKFEHQNLPNLAVKNGYVHDNGNPNTKSFIKFIKRI